MGENIPERDRLDYRNEIHSVANWPNLLVKILNYAVVVIRKQ